ncbi:MAG: type I-C CRISPR-associated protein Cas8c/Csd1, partial [Lachnospiraceae bacterium]|nr:type I-C CRISPR-associated protein Cas8c/Csd1 [Lachnospiraceae bacterium]
MGWIDELYNLYENNCERTDLVVPMLPLSHSTANAQIEVVIDQRGNFQSASRIDKADAETVIPVTNDSSAKTSGITPHPFADKLIYIAGDYDKYVVGKKKDSSKYYEAYMTQLESWKQSIFSHEAVCALFQYLQNATIMSDLISCGVLSIEEKSGCLKNGEKIAGIAQEDSFVRFRIFYDDMDKESRTWMDKTLYDSFISYYASVMEAEKAELCYATGKNLPLTYKHPWKIRNARDKAKLISSSDPEGFTYRGRFHNKEQALSVSYDFSQKMHNGLKWIINRQGINIENSLTLIVWESTLAEMPNPTLDFMSAFGFSFDDENTKISDTYPAYRQQLLSSVMGRKTKLKPQSKTMVLGLDSATTGRLSIVLYTELEGSEFLDNIEKWHLDTAWMRFNGKQRRTIINSFSLYELIECAFGTEEGNFIRAKSGVIKDYMCRLIPCVIERRRIPVDLVQALINKVSNPLAYEFNYNWQKVLEASCGMIRKSYIEKGAKCEMA